MTAYFNNRSAVQVALRALAHPASLAAIALLLLNDHFLKTEIPGWLTGKLSDFAGLFFFPFLLAVLVGSVWKRPTPLTVGKLAFATTAVWFAAAKATLLGHQLTSEFASVLLGANVIITPDPTDLLALLSLLPAWLLWNRSMELAHAPISAHAVIPAVVVAALGVMATSPMEESLGVYQIRTMQGKSFAFHEGRGRHGIEFSSDHGATWSPYLGDTAALVSDGPVALMTPSRNEPTGDTAMPYKLTPPVLSIQHPDSPNVWYRSTSSWRHSADTLHIDRSTDSGRTWVADLLIPPSRMEYVARSEHSTGGTEGPTLGVRDLDIFNDGSGVVIAAAGAGVLVRDSNGEWSQYSVNRWEALRPEATFRTFLFRPIQQEFFALIGLAVLAGHLTGFVGWRRLAATVGLAGNGSPNNGESEKIFGAKTGAVGLLCGLLMSLTGLSLQSDLTGLLVLMLYVPAGIIGLLFLVRNALRLGGNRLFRQASRWSLYATALSLIAPLLVFVLWAFGVIEWYRHALIAAMIVWGGVVGFSINRAGQTSG